MLGLNRLRVLCEVARQGSLAAAAQALAYTPSAVSQQIAALERETGVKLVERLPRGVRLTEPGRTLVRHAQAILAELRAAEASLAAIARAQGGRLRFGSFPTANADLMPRAAARFRQEHPGVRLLLHECDPDDAFARLAERELDIALVYEFPVMPFNGIPQGVELVWLLDDPPHVAFPPDHPLAARPRLRLADLADADWIQGVRRGSTLGVLPNACRAAGFEPRIVFQTDDKVTVQGLVAAGVGVAVVATLMLPTIRPDLVIRPLDEPCLTRRVSAALQSGPHRLPAADAMLAILLRAAK